MLTGRAVLERPDVNYLQPTRLFVQYPDQPTRTGPGCSATDLREQGRLAGISKAQARSAIVRKPGSIATSGRARSDAKRSLRLLAGQSFEACIVTNEDGEVNCRGQALPGTDRCRWHAEPEAWAAFLRTKPPVAA